MKRAFILFAAFSLAFGCSQQDEVAKKTSTSSDLTGNSVTYSLQAGSYWNVDGSIVFNEKTDGTALIEIKVNNLGEDDADQHPVHLHLGDLSVDKAGVAAQLNPVDGKTGQSTTNLKMLADESLITYAQLKELNACIKIHLAASGEGQSIVLAGSNVGTAVSQTTTNGRVSSLGICKSE
ncbi:MAG TPA: hypothetical protein VIM65_24640 [Cyclobacteriaceae bacterium]